MYYYCYYLRGFGVGSVGCERTTGAGIEHDIFQLGGMQPVSNYPGVTTSVSRWWNVCV